MSSKKKASLTSESEKIDNVNREIVEMLLSSLSEWITKVLKILCSRRSFQPYIRTLRLYRI